MRNMGFYTFVVILLGAFGFYLFVHQPAPSGPPVHFILPDAWRGKFKLVLDRAGGIQIDLKNGRYTYRIPEIGVLRVKSFAPLQQWHGITMAYEGGRSIPARLDPGRTPHTITFYSLRVTSSVEAWYLIATDDGRKAVYEEDSLEWRVGAVAQDKGAMSESAKEQLSDVQDG